MSEHRIKIPRVTDRRVAAVFQKLAQTHGLTGAEVVAIGEFPIGPINLRDEPGGNWKALLAQDIELIERLTYTMDNVSIAYARGGQYPEQDRSPIYDELIVRVTHRPDFDNWQQVLKILADVTRDLNPVSPAQVPPGAMSPEQGALLAMHTSMLQRLEALNVELVRKGVEYRDEVDRALIAGRERLNDEAEEMRAAMTSAADAKEQLLRERERALADKEQAIDDRSNTHVRREIRDRMLRDVTERIERFGVSESTESKRTPVHVGLVMLIAVLAMLLVYALIDMRNVTPSSGASSGATVIAVSWVRASLLTFGLIAAIVFYIRWQMRWADRHADAEFQLRQFHVDVNRANWVLESCLEWRSNGDQPIPDALLASMTSGLFARDDKGPADDLNPADTLASALLGSASKLRLKAGENEIEFDKPGKALRKSTATQAAASGS